MAISPHLVIAIARQLGSGGSYIGQAIARRLGIPYLDREILQQAARELGSDEASLAERDERLQSFWTRLLQGFGAGTPFDVYSPPPLPPMRIISDYQIFETERRLIVKLAQQGPCVIVGHGGCFLLKDQARQLSVFIHAPTDFRKERVMQFYHAANAEEAMRMIEQTDGGREEYVAEFMKQKWCDARNYHLSIDSQAIGLDAAVEMIVATAQQLG